MADWIRRALWGTRLGRRPQAERVREAVMLEWLLYGGLGH